MSKVERSKAGSVGAALRQDYFTTRRIANLHKLKRSILRKPQKAASKLQLETLKAAAVPTIPSSYLSRALDDTQPRKYFSNIPSIPSIKKNLTANTSFSERHPSESVRSISPMRLRILKEKLIKEYGEELEDKNLKGGLLKTQQGRKLSQSPNYAREAVLAKPKRISDIAVKGRKFERKSSIERKKRYEAQVQRDKEEAKLKEENKKQIFEIMKLGYAGKDTTMDEFEARLGGASRVHKSLDISKLRVETESLKVQTCSKFSVVMDACADKVELQRKGAALLHTGPLPRYGGRSFMLGA